MDGFLPLSKLEFLFLDVLGRRHLLVFVRTFFPILCLKMKTLWLNKS